MGAAVVFSDILSQVKPIATTGSDLNIAVIDDGGHRIWGLDAGDPTMVREFPLLFLDPSVSMVALGSNRRSEPGRSASHAPDSALVGAAEGADEALLAAGAAA